MPAAGGVKFSLHEHCYCTWCLPLWCQPHLPLLCQVRIRDMRARTEEEGDAEAILPQWPRIYGDDVTTEK